MSFNVNNIEEKVKIECIIKNVSRNKSGKKEKDFSKWKKSLLKRKRRVSKNLPTMSRCNNRPVKKSIFGNKSVKDVLNLTIVEKMM